MRHCIWGLAVGFFLMASGANALPGPLHLQPDGTAGLVVIVDLRMGAQLLDDVHVRFGDVPAVARLVARLRAFSFHGLRPFESTFGDGFAPERGLAVFVTRGGTEAATQGMERGGEPGLGLRFVVGAKEPERVRLTLEGLFRFFEGDVSHVSKDRCTGIDGYLVCDTTPLKTASRQPPLPKIAGEIPGLPSAYALLLPGVVPSPRPDVEMGGGVAWYSKAEDRGSVGLRVELSALGTGSAAPFSPLSVLRLFIPPPREAPPSLVAPETAFFVRAHVDGKGLLTLLRLVSGGASNDVLSALDTLAAGWTGALTLTSDGGFMHPVLMLGLNQGAAGDQVMPALSRLIATLVTTRLGACVDEPRQECLVLDFKDSNLVSQAPLPPAPSSADVVPTLALTPTLRLRSARSGDQLVVALSPADVARRQSPDFVSMAWPESMRETGLLGLYLAAVPTFEVGAWMAELLEFQGWVGAWVDWQVLGNLMSALVSEFSMVFRVSGSAVSFDADWRCL